MSIANKRMNATETIKKLDKKIKQWISNWVSTPTPRELFLDEPMSAFTNYLNGQDISYTLGDQSENLATWHLINYENTAFKGEPNYEELAYATFHYGQMLEIKKSLADIDSGGSILLAVSALSFSLAAISGWKNECAARFNILKTGLDSPLLHLQKNEKHDAGKLFRHFWFLLELYARSIGQNIDTSIYSYPTKISPYDRVLQNWDTSDQAVLQELISQMADFHLSQTLITERNDVLEFDYEERMLFPYEILAFLRIREWANLKNPITFDHPLMQHPLAKIPPTLNMPNIHPFKDAIDELKKRYRSKTEQNPNKASPQNMSEDKAHLSTAQCSISSQQPTARSQQQRPHLLPAPRHPRQGRHVMGRHGRATHRQETDNQLPRSPTPTNPLPPAEPSVRPTSCPTNSPNTLGRVVGETAPTALPTTQAKEPHLITPGYKMNNYEISPYVGVGELEFGISPSMAEKILGKPNFSYYDPDTDATTQYWNNNGLQLSFSKKK